MLISHYIVAHKRESIYPMGGNRIVTRRSMKWGKQANYQGAGRERLGQAQTDRSGEVRGAGVLKTCRCGERGEGFPLTTPARRPALRRNAEPAAGGTRCGPATRSPTAR
jgi:hypothetical protein